MSLKCIDFLYVIKSIIVNDCFVICVGLSLLSKIVDVTAHALLFIFNLKLILFIQNKIFKKLFALFLQIQEIPYPSFPSLSSKRDHEEMEQEDDEVMEGTDKKIKT